MARNDGITNPQPLNYVYPNGNLLNFGTLSPVGPPRVVANLKNSKRTVPPVSSPFPGGSFGTFGPFSLMVTPIKEEFISSHHHLASLDAGDSGTGTWQNPIVVPDTSPPELSISLYPPPASRMMTPTSLGLDLSSGSANTYSFLAPYPQSSPPPRVAPPKAPPLNSIMKRKKKKAPAAPAAHLKAAGHVTSASSSCRKSAMELVAQHLPAALHQQQQLFASQSANSSRSTHHFTEEEILEATKKLIWPKKRWLYKYRFEVQFQQHQRRMAY